MKKIASSSLELLSALHFNPKACNFNFKFEFSSIKPISTNINQSKSINSKISANKGKLGGLNIHISALITHPNLHFASPRAKQKNQTKKNKK